MRIAYFLLYFVPIFGINQAKKSRPVPRPCMSLKIDSLKKISELKKTNANLEHKMQNLEIDNDLLNAKISMYENQNQTTKYACPETQPTINLENLPDRFKCDTNGKETESQCIQKLQAILQQFISVDQELKIHREKETHVKYEKRLEFLVAKSREDATSYRRLYDRCKSDIIMQQDN